MTRATAVARANVALVKYFGKRDTALNLPAAGSLSITLEPLHTSTHVAFQSGPGPDEIYLNDAPAAEGFSRRTSRFLDLLRSLSNTSDRAVVRTANDFPTAAGLASSASGFAALTLAATAALDMESTPQRLSELARRGSGSAARSIPGGFVVWREGCRDDGSDSIAESIAPVDYWDVAIVVGIANAGPKEIGSTNAMEDTRRTSPYYSAFIETTRRLVLEAEDAVLKRDLEKLGDIAEHSALAMHAATLAARPAIPFFNGTTMDALHLVRRLRKDGIGAWFTCDAGPQPKIFCHADDAEQIGARLASLEGISGVIQCRPGNGAELITDH